MGSQEFPEGDNEQRGTQTVHDGTHLHDMRIQDRLHWRGLEDSTAGQCNVEDRFPPSIQSEPQEATSTSQGALTQSWLRRHPGQSVRLLRTIIHKTLSANRPGA